MTTPQLRRNAPSSLDVHSLRKALAGITDYDILIHQAAKWYANNGFMIVPFRPGNKEGKFSGYPKGLSQRHASKQLEKIDEWFHPTDGLYPGASIAMAHGGKSGFCAIDLDCKTTIKKDGSTVSVDGIATLADLQFAYGGYDDGQGEGLQTLMATTPSGGRHLIFRYHPEIISNADVVYEGIDTRGGLKSNPIENGGITFVEPSRKPKTGGTYQWDDTITDIIDMPQWLVDVLNGRTPKLSTGGMKLQDSYVQSAPGDHGEGRDRNIYMDLMRFAGIGYTEDQLWALMPDILERMDPPDEDMVRRKIESVIASDAFKKAKEEKKTVEQVSSVKLIRDSKERVIQNVENLEAILTSPIFSHEYGDIEYDDFTQNFICNKAPMASVVDWSLGIQSWLSHKFKVDYPKTEIRDRIEYIAFSRPHANTAREYMLACPTPARGIQPDDFWGSGRKGPGPAFKRLYSEVLDLDNPLLHPHYGPDTREAYIGFLWFWMQGVVARACVPGCKMEIMLNIFGGQGIGKSLFFSKLCPNPTWFTDSIQDSIVSGGMNNRDELMKLHAKIIVEMPELNPIKRGGKSADDKLKQFISAQVDNFRRPYGRDSVDNLRTCALAGTSNNRDVYRDSTGSRRFVSIDHGDLPIRLGDKDSGVMDEIRDAMWGELVNSFNYGELDRSPNHLLVYIPSHLRNHQNTINSLHKFEEIGIMDILDWMSDKSRITWNEILAYAKMVPGLRDAKESMVMSMVRKELSNDSDFEFKKRITRTTEDNKKEKVNCWFNNKIDNVAPGVPVPDHWSKGKPLISENDEY